MKHTSKKTYTSDGSTGKYYKIPEGTREIQELVSYKNMNGQIAEMFRTCYRYGEASHSKQLREAMKLVFYSLAEVHRIMRFEQGYDVRFGAWFQVVRELFDKRLYGQLNEENKD